MNISANPFVQQTMIREPEQFVGRRTELEQILHLLKQMQGISLVGERRIGKSSLLYHVFQTGTARLSEETLIAYTDFPDVKDEKSFYACLCRQLGKMGDKFSDLEEAVRDRRVVFCLDEFERVLRSPAFSREFFDTLRSLAQTDNLALLIATEHPLSELSLTEQIATSPFFNIFRQLEIGLFTPAEALEFITAGFAETTVEITENEIERVLRRAGRFPFFLRLACYCLFEMKVGRAPEWERAFRRDARPHLQYLWSRLKPSERATLRRVLNYGDDSNEEAVEELARRGLIAPRQDGQGRRGWQLFAEVFEDFAAHPPSRPWRDRPRHWWSRFRRWFKGGKIGAGPVGEIQFERPGDKPRTEDKR